MDAIQKEVQVVQTGFEIQKFVEEMFPMGVTGIIPVFKKGKEQGAEAADGEDEPEVGSDTEADEPQQQKP